jgi:hypothetical protein
MDFRKAFDSVRGEETGQWGKLHNEELNDLFPHPVLFM